jgi:hypothetical protein
VKKKEERGAAALAEGWFLDKLARISIREGRQAQGGAEGGTSAATRQLGRLPIQPPMLTRLWT